MTDESFEHEVGAAARRVANCPAPDALRARVASIPVDHPRATPRAGSFGTLFRSGAGQVAAALIVATVVVVGLSLREYRGPAALPSFGPSRAPTGLASSAADETAIPPSVTRHAAYELDANLIAASEGRLYGFVAPGSGTKATIVRVDRGGSITQESLSDALVPYYSWLAANTASLYLGTSVGNMATGVTNELVRIDASNLKVSARTVLAGDVIGLIADANGVWVALPDRVLSFDPGSLALRGSMVIPGTAAPPAGSASVNAMAMGPGDILVTVVGAASGRLYRLNLADLSIVDAIDLPDPEQVTGVVANGESAWLTGTDWVQRLDPRDELGSRTSTPSLQAAAAQGQGLVALIFGASGSESLLEISPAGAVIGRSEVGDAGARIALDGTDVWLLDGLSVAQWTLDAQP